MSPILFVHIPKTAGTSFRGAAAEYFGEREIELDYGATEPETTPLALEHIYGSMNADCYGLFEALMEQKKSLLGGHFNVAKYSPLFGAANIIAFCRDPLERAKSHYLHRKRVMGIEESFKEFIELPAYQNLQSRYMQNVPLEAVGVFGLTERYNDSLKLIEHEFDFSLPAKALNQSPRKDVLELSTDDERRFNELNQGDLNLYQAARYNFARHMTAVNNNEDFVRCVAKYENKHVFGWAFKEGHEVAVDISIQVNSETRAETRAVDYRPHLDALGVSRKGYVGFKVRIGDVNKGDILELKHGKTIIYSRDF